MSINPPSDLIADAIRAADPARAAKAEARLMALGREKTDSGFGEVVGQVAARPPTSARVVAPVARPPMRAAPAPISANGQRKAAMVKFEGAILGFLVKELLPKDQSAMGGTGQAGDMWRSLLADEIGGQIAKSGALRLQERLFETHPLHSVESSASATRAASTGGDGRNTTFNGNEIRVGSPRIARRDA